jgi:hypothetical protein
MSTQLIENGSNHGICEVLRRTLGAKGLLIVELDQNDTAEVSFVLPVTHMATAGLVMRGIADQIDHMVKEAEEAYEKRQENQGQA